MKTPKNVQIPYEVFCDLLQYFIMRNDDPELFYRLEGAIQKKCDDIRKRDLYSRSKDTTLSHEEREKARIEYLDLVGMRESFRY